MNLFGVGVGVGVGVLAAELSWYLVQPALLRSRSDRIDLRNVLAVFTVSSGVLGIFLLDRIRWPRGLDPDYWSTAVVAYAVPFLWFICRLLEPLVSAPTSRILRLTTSIMSWLTFAFLLGLLSYAVPYVARYRHVGALICSVITIAAVGVLIVRLKPRLPGGLS